MEEELSIFENGRQSQKNLNGRRPNIFLLFLTYFFELTAYCSAYLSVWFFFTKPKWIVKLYICYPASCQQIDLSHNQIYSHSNSDIIFAFWKSLCVCFTIFWWFESRRLPWGWGYVTIHGHFLFDYLEEFDKTGAWLVKRGLEVYEEEVSLLKLRKYAGMQVSMWRVVKWNLTDADLFSSSSFFKILVSFLQNYYVG